MLETKLKQVGTAIFCGLIFLGFTQDGYAKRKKPEKGRNFIWKIENKNKQHAYLVGSIHMLKKEYYPLRPLIEEAFKASDVLAVEANINQNQGRDIDLIMKNGLLGDDLQIKDKISPKTYDLTVKSLSELGMTIDTFRKFKPWFLALSLTSLQIVKLGFDPNLGLDKHFLDQAQGNKPIVELEGVQFQINLFNGFSDEENDHFLYYSLLESKGYEKEMEKLFSAWSVGNTKAMQKLLAHTIHKFPHLKDIYKKIIDDRNVTMGEKIQGFLRSGKRHFVIVGAAHLVGPKGILNILKKKNFLINQL